jgi:hypothetical protein
MFVRFALQTEYVVLRDWLSENKLDVEVWTDVARNFMWNDRARGLRRSTIEQKQFALWINTLPIANNLLPKLNEISEMISNDLGEIVNEKDTNKKYKLLDAALKRAEQLIRVRTSLLSGGSQNAAQIVNNITQQAALLANKNSQPNPPRLSSDWRGGHDHASQTVVDNDD